MVRANQDVRSHGAEITRILRESNAHPDALEKLRAYSFEEIWLTVRSYDVYGDPDVVFPARKALQLWPDWPERIWQRTERILAPARNPKREGPLDKGVFPKSVERAHTECVWLTVFLRAWVTPEVVRIVGPMLFEPGKKVRVDDIIYGSASGFAIAVLQDLQTTGSEAA